MRSSDLEPPTPYSVTLKPAVTHFFLSFYTFTLPFSRIRNPKGQNPPSKPSKNCRESHKRGRHNRIQPSLSSPHIYLLHVKSGPSVVPSTRPIPEYGVGNRMSAMYAEEESLHRPRSMIQLSTNALSDHHQPEDNRLSSSTDEPDLQRLLEEDGLANESSLKRPRAWRNLASLILARRPRRLQKLGRDDTPFCNAGEKRLPQRRKGRRTLTLCCLGTILSLYEILVISLTWTVG